MAKAYARPELLASPDWVAANLERPDVRLLDVRWRPDGTGRTVWQAGHIPGAAYLDWSTDLVQAEDDAPSFHLGGPDQVAAALGSLGVGDGTTVVLYDDSASLFAARAWWSMRVYGYGSARILDGGIDAWTSEGRSLSNGSPATVPSVFTPHAQLRDRLSWSDVRGLLGSPEVLLLDARAPADYRGHQGNARRLGHIPGAVNVPVAVTTKPGTGRFRDGDELRPILSRAGVQRGRRLVCYDGSGIAAAKLTFVLALLGYDDVAMYDGGWAEWGDRLDLPVER
ncbi:MAG TPA: sulfurtransferase [Candidatus Limnocylindrales bacterium]